MTRIPALFAPLKPAFVVFCLLIASGCASVPSGPASRDDYARIYDSRCNVPGVDRPAYCDR